MTNTLLATVTFGTGGNARAHLGEGWARDEPNFVWGIGPESTLILPRPAGSAKYTLQMRVFPFVFTERVPSQRLTIMVNGTELATHALTQPAELECDIPEHVAAGLARFEIVFKHPDAAKPSDFQETNDNRSLAIAFRECRLLTGAATPGMAMTPLPAPVPAAAPAPAAKPTPTGVAVPPLESDYLVPPAELLFDGSTTQEDFKRVGQGFTRVNLIARGRLQPHERVLDLGSGNGQKARVLAYYLNRQGSYEGLDIVKAGVEWCQQRYAVFPNFRFQHADIQSSHYNPTGLYRDAEYRLTFPDGDFDMVFLSSVFTHMLPDGVANYITEISRVLKPGGRCVATFFLLNRDSIARIVAGTSSLNFIYLFGSTYRVVDMQNPSKSVALQEDWVRERFGAAGLRVAEACYGTWAGGRDLLAAYQDVLIALKE